MSEQSPGADKNAGAVTRLQNTNWHPHYSHEDGDLVHLFFEPALSAATLYQRVTGYFSADVLALAARGLDSLIARGGRMQLIIGCTLGPDEIKQIEEGYKLRDLIETSLAARLGLSTDSPEARKQLGWLSWMVANGHLDIKLAIPKSSDGRFAPGLGLYHAKAGILTDAAGERLTFTGSINETEAGWLRNWESFDVSCSWRGEWDAQRVTMAVHEFGALWSNRMKTAEVLEFPDALRLKLLEYLPKDDRVIKPPMPEPEPVTPEEKPEVPAADEVVDLDGRRRLVWSFIRNAARLPGGESVAVKTSTVEAWPHQLRAYRRMLDSWPFRLLIADEVGLGKTIEAGMILRHAWISGLAKRVLIMVPKAVLRQWQSELYEKFNLLVPIYTGRSFVWPEHHARTRPLEEDVERSKWTHQPLVLVSSHLMRRQERQQELIDAEDWDLLILDEAQHVRRRGVGTPQERGPNRLLGLMHKIKDKAKALLLMTATPMQVHPVEVWDLLNLLGLPPEWTERAFVGYFDELAKNPDEKGLRQLALLFQATEKAYGRTPDGEIERVAQKFCLTPIERKRILAALREPVSIIPIKQLSTRERKVAMALLKVGSPVRSRMSRHTRTLLREYYRKGLLDTPIADRKVEDVAILLTPPERALYDAVEDYISTTYQMADPSKKSAVGFVMTVYRRRLASSFFALRRTLEKRLARIAEADVAEPDEVSLEEDISSDDSADEAMAVEDAAILEDQTLDLEEQNSIRGLLKAAAMLGTDSKALRLVQELQEGFAAGYDRAIVFTQYTDTMDFLKDFLAERLDVAIGCFSGDGGQTRDASGLWTSCSKEQIKRRFAKGELHVLVCTDAAGVGLNLQSCGFLINHDLPWNPMKVEQRIGRVDRIGQLHPTVRVVNLAYKDTVEADVYFALQERIGLFNGVVGKLQPILSQLPRQFETTVLAGKGERERARYDVVHKVGLMVDTAEASGFDIDEVSEGDLKPPVFPASPLEPEDLDIVLSRENLLPPGVECHELDPQTYAITVPGNGSAARVTTSPAIFDDHFESHQLILHGSPIFDIVAKALGPVDEEELTKVGQLRHLFEDKG